MEQIKVPAYVSAAELLARKKDAAIQKTEELLAGLQKLQQYVTATPNITPQNLTAACAKIGETVDQILQNENSLRRVENSLISVLEALNTDISFKRNGVTDFLGDATDSVDLTVGLDDMVDINVADMYLVESIAMAFGVAPDNISVMPKE